MFTKFRLADYIVLYYLPEFKENTFECDDKK